MSLKFNTESLTDRGGIIQQLEDRLGFNPGDIADNDTLLARFTSSVNLALDEVISLILSLSGTWQFDDSNHEDYPIITTDIIENQRDYSFVTDEQGNLILDIYRVFRANADGVFEEIFPTDAQSDQGTEDFTDGRDITGIPAKYDKTANGIFFDVLPSYSSDGGLKVYINREGSYFAIDDTDKVPGFAGLFHEYLVLKPAAEYAADKTLANAISLENKRVTMIKKIEDYYTERQKDFRPVMKAADDGSWQM